MSISTCLGTHSSLILQIQSLKYPRRYSNNHTHTKAPPAPIKAVPNGKLMGALCQSEVDKMVDVNLPLTMN